MDPAVERHRSHKKKYERRVRLGVELGVNPFELTSEQIVALEELLPSIRAKRRIDAGNYDPTNYEQVYELWLAAYEDERIASDAKSQSLRMLVDKHCGKMP